MRLLRAFLNDMIEGLKAMQERRDSFWYMYNHHITPTECLLLERYPETAESERAC